MRKKNQTGGVVKLVASGEACGFWAMSSTGRAQMAWVPVEEISRDRQDAYYGAISDADRTGDARRFIEFMLLALRDALVDVKRSVGKGVVKSVVKILDLIAQYPDITRERLAREVGLSVRGVGGGGAGTSRPASASRSTASRPQCRCHDSLAPGGGKGDVCLRIPTSAPLRLCAR